MAAYPNYNEPVHWFVNPPGGVRPSVPGPAYQHMSGAPLVSAPPVQPYGHPYPLPHWTQLYGQLHQLPFSPLGY
jgi:hypothetical protein